MARLFGQLNNNSLCGPTGCAQGVPAKSQRKTKGGLFTWAVLMGDTAVKPLLGHDKEIASPVLTAIICYIYIHYYDTKFPFLPLYYEQFEAFC